MRKKITELLNNSDYGGLMEIYGSGEHRVVRHLIALSYNMQDVTAWRAMKALGLISSLMPADALRELAQKVLWMMREESGTNAWSAPVIMGEILRENPGGLQDIVPILASFHKEAFFTPGVIYALTRLADRDSELVRPLFQQLAEHFHSDNPEITGNLITLIGRLGLGEHKDFVEKGLANGSAFTFFNGEDLTETSVKETARKTLKELP